VVAAIGGRARTIAIDRPGWNGRGSPSDLAGNARAALLALSAEGVRRATVVGHSLGGAVAALLAADHPEYVASLVLAAPSANRASLNRLDRLLATPLVGPTIVAAGLVGAGVALEVDPLRRGISATVGLSEDYLRMAGRALLRPATWRVFAFEQRMLVDELPALEERLAAISAPTTVVSGTADRIVTASSARRLAAQIQGAELVQLPGAAHLLPQQRPGELAEIIVRASGSG
jgi:pimeloyl-ACP methyl ester carboxylesterase